MSQRREGRRGRGESASHDALPPFGEPVKIGHHSERRHRNALDKAWRAFGRSVEAGRDATRAHHRAESAAHTTEHRHSPRTVANRIEGLCLSGVLPSRICRDRPENNNNETPKSRPYAQS
ncbi:DUF3560 domain-containing protein [Nocardia abscessus]|uniref:DUF3560 domain-containing protein n=1 Tax=Nocardia abscessus TaxID=120957 RepID=UPI003CC7D614